MPTSLDRSDRGAAIVGAACRFPGAPSLDAFWRLMMEGRNAVRAAPEGRWAVERFLRPGKPEAGFSYTFAGGYLDEPFVFDPAPFGLSPREAQQMDPQQRLLLEVVWEALEDAGLPPAALSGANVGVYIGASSVDYQFNASNDPAIIDSHFMTGNTLSILSNRISYVFNLKGPSVTLDSACASSFSALDAAMAALEQGRIHLAIVGGVNMLLSPVPFIGFSQARMLSPTGLSRPFSQDGDGYVRAEGAGVMVLRRAGEARALGESIRAVIVGAALNCDGRTSGISLPSMEGQRDLIATLYDRLGLGPDDLAFVEAHGTGTKVGDPVEANAIGRVLGQGRATKLPIGSVKSNIGHLEAASGVAALLKAMLALERRTLPPWVFLDRLNEAIDFEALNIAPNAAARALDLEGRAIHAGVCNYGFGGA
ncbi:MAG: polyketide synthase, partial [Methylobacteriaceae bacterium]|nr:polyketide synthase [Methylobacteriaceae bacterium]